ncbi:MAG: hypothetical protein HQL41_05855 [Alphaproteobacteria bacterium]|nr:hypothetical protein [Alphaproteobacteria bacterium]
MASDSALTRKKGQGSEENTAEIPGPKIFPIADNCYFAFAGNAELADLIFEFIQKRMPVWLDAAASAKLDGSDLALKISKELRKHFIDKHDYESVYRMDTDFITLLPLEEGPTALTFGGLFRPSKLSPRRPHITCGTGIQFADPFLVFLNKACGLKEMTVERARFLAYWLVSHVIDSNTGGVNGPVQMVSLTRGRTGAVPKVEFDADQMNQRIGELYRLIGSYVLDDDGPSARIPLPKPTATP